MDTVRSNIGMFSIELGAARYELETDSIELDTDRCNLDTVRYELGKYSINLGTVRYELETDSSDLDTVRIALTKGSFIHFDRSVAFLWHCPKRTRTSPIYASSRILDEFSHRTSDISPGWRGITSCAIVFYIQYCLQTSPN